MGARRLDRREADRARVPEQEALEGRFSKYPIRQIHRAEIYDISYSGIAFRINHDLTPEIGELVAIEFRLPGAAKMAWYAQVVRMEIEAQQATHSLVRVGARFLEIPPARRKALEGHIDTLLEKIHGNQSARITILTEALEIIRSDEISSWRNIRLGIALVLALGAAIWFIGTMKSIGGRELRGQGPNIWPGYKDHQPLSFRPDWPGIVEPKEKPKDEN